MKKIFFITSSITVFLIIVSIIFLVFKFKVVDLNTNINSNQNITNINDVDLIDYNKNSNKTISTSTSNPQIGLNFIRYFFTEDGFADRGYNQPSWMEKNMKDLGVQSQRQLIKGDVLWDVVEPQDNQWNFTQTDAVLMNTQVAPIVTLFYLQYSSATPPWETDGKKFQKRLGVEAKDYLKTVVTRYADYVKYWEIGNEMDHWRISNSQDPFNQKNDAKKIFAEESKTIMPDSEFTPEEQGIFFKEVSQLIRDIDPDAVILMPGMGGLDDYTINTWFKSVLIGGGNDWFDIINYHYYSSWEPFVLSRKKLQNFIEQNNLLNKNVWLTEAGVTSDPTLTIRTDYPNSDKEQAAEIFRMSMQSWANGDENFIWHTYIGSAGQSDWRHYGIIDNNGDKKISYSSFELLTKEIIPFLKIETVNWDPQKRNIYKITKQNNDILYVAWGSGEFMIPVNMSAMVSVVPDENKEYKWQEVKTGQKIFLSELPIIVK